MSLDQNHLRILEVVRLSNASLIRFFFKGMYYSKTFLTCLLIS